MRPIKFRAWDEELKKMFIPSHIDGFGVLVIEERHEIGEGMFGTHPIEYPRPYQLMQFTGLLDSKGKEIWEGDLVKTYGGSGEVRFGSYSAGGQDYYSQDAYGFYVQRSSYKDDTETLTSGYEIIGNIYENPELIQP